MERDGIPTIALTTPRERMQHYVDEAYKYSQSTHDGVFEEEIVAIHDSRASVAASAAIAEAIMHLAEVISNK